MADEDAAARELGIQPNLSMDDLRDVYNVLFRLDMSEPSLILDILDLAGFWLCSTCTRLEYVRVVDTDLVYVAVQAPNAPVRALSHSHLSSILTFYPRCRTRPTILHMLSLPLRTLSPLHLRPLSSSSLRHPSLFRPTSAAEKRPN